MSLSRCQINPIDVNFHLQKSLEIFDKNSADKIWSKKDKEIKVSPLMPIRVNHWSIYFYEANDNYSGQFSVSIEVCIIDFNKKVNRKKQKKAIYLLTSALAHQKQNTKFKGTNIRRSNQDRWNVWKSGVVMWWAKSVPRLE